MQIDITKLLNGYINSLEIDEQVNIPNELISNSLITELKDIKLKGKISVDEDYNINLNGELYGIMMLKDDVTLEPVEHKFNTQIEEILEKSQNILDITEILWQNILVEIPSKVRCTDEDINLAGNGWRVISEEEFLKERNKSNNPFANLDELLNTKEDR